LEFNMGIVTRIKQAVAATFLFAIRWRAEGERPTPARYVLIAAPHTSYWDGLLVIALGWRCDIPFVWFVKHTLMRGPVGWLLRKLGAIAVDRRAPQQLVARVVEEFGRRPEIALVVPPEGSRGLVPYWRSGFLAIAREAGVPLVLGYLDYGRRCGGFGPTVHLTENVRADMDVLRAFYADKQGRFPDQFTPPLLRIEIEQPGPAASPSARREAEDRLRAPAPFHAVVTEQD
jgi:1-acyl-sn-glycerol-3-phosphate acyltransferase